MKILKKYIQEEGNADIYSLPKAATTDLQTVLKHLGYYDLPVDGIVGDGTLSALANFKEESWLQFPATIGKSTIEALQEAQSTHPVSEQVDNLNQDINPDAGNKTGKSMVIATGETVYANQYVIPGIPLTWGEVTDNCNRVLKEKYLIANAHKIVRAFGVIRDKFGSPIMITSGYRPPNINAAVGGVPNSRHVSFEALDMSPLNGNLDLLWQIMVASSLGGLGDGRYRRFCHGDIRPYRAIFGY